MGGEVGPLVLRRLCRARRRLLAERFLPREQPAPGPHGVRSRVRRLGSRVLVDQPRPRERHRRGDPRRLQRGATEIFQEGIRITPLRHYAAGTLRDDVLEMLKTNVRHPRDIQGDLAAMIGSARVGERRLLALLAEYGAPLVRAAVEAILDGAERQARACLMTWEGRDLPGRGDPRRRRPRLPRCLHPRDREEDRSDRASISIRTPGAPS